MYADDIAAPSAPSAAVPHPQGVRLSSAQQQAWFLERLVPDTVAYNFQARFTITGPLDVAALTGALADLIIRHEILRTVFLEGEDTPYQVVQAPWLPELPMVDLAGVPEGMRDSYAELLIETEIRKRIDVGRLPLVRWLLVRQAPDRHLLLHIEHHLVHDGWSYRLFMRELAALYSARVRGGGVDAELTNDLDATLGEVTQFADYCRWEGAWLDSAEGRGQRAFWRDRLAGWPAYGHSLVAGVAERRQALTFSGASQSFPIPGATLGALVDLATATRTTLFELMLTIFGALVRERRGLDRVIIGTAIANRDQPETQTVIGMLVNMLPLRLQGDGSLSDLLAATREEVRAAFLNGRIPVSTMVEDLQPARVANALPYIQTSFSFHNSMTRDLAFHGLTVEVTEGVSNGSAKFDLNVIVVFDDEANPRRGGRVLAEYAHDLAPAGDIQAFFEDFLAIAARWAATPHLDLARLRAGGSSAVSGRDVDLAYWRRALADLEDARLAGPAYHTARASGHRARLSQSLPKTPHAPDLLAAYALVLARHTGGDDVLFGYRPEGRAEALPLRLRVDEDQSWTALKGHAASTAASGLAHGDLPLAILAEAVADGRDGGLFQTALVMGAGGAPSTALELCVAGDRLTLDYDDGLLTEAQVARLGASLVQVLAAAQPEAPLTDIPSMDAAERDRVLTWSTGATPAFPDRTVHGQFEYWAARQPDAVALRHGGVRKPATVSYGALDQAAARIAAGLRLRGVEPGDTVGIAASRSPALIAALLGILKAGAAYVPFETDFPAERQRLILVESRARLVLTDAPDAITAGLDLPVVVIDPLLSEAPPARTDGAASAIRSPEAGPADRAYIMFTSGSTGTPKGVHSTHEAVVSLVCDTDYLAVAPTDRLMAFAPLSFDASTFEMWAALLNGASLLLPPVRTGLDELAELVAAEKVSILWMTTALFKELVEAHPATVAATRWAMTGGDIVPPDSVRALFAAPGACRLMVAYGPTEATTFTTCHEITRDAPLGDRVSIGRPIAHTNLYLLDRRGRLVPPGVPGEIAIGGRRVSGAYIDRPALTAERFIPNPFIPGDTLFRSGDVGIWAEDGTLDFQGRTDDQVKIRGFRVEPGEVEAVLRRLDGVRDATVIAHRTPRDKRLVGFVVPQAGADLTEASLRAALRATLPDYMVPARFLLVEALPLQTTGKLDKRRLNRLADEAASDGGTPDTAPSSLEPMVAGVWREILGLAAVAPEDDFFALGGHSLAAMRIMSRLSREVGRRLPLSLLFEGPTVRALAAAIDARRSA
ncbi:non-ribosomal peptide synthetase [Nitrospirillum pindoramense]|uniref:Amino acid adenylation domain-containing protein n=1 Tax=Nitrospirillum amazonense TaxID=28077 RepID=A0A560GTB6_9PROT|nr:non-ribosomal peptide synthetase [Nitrospirillum amazonense]TWB37257.1 amino acid adenylation domain-containing protein [Nitrospirillum amazonense]